MRVFLRYSLVLLLCFAVLLLAGCRGATAATLDDTFPPQVTTQAPTEQPRATEAGPVSITMPPSPTPSPTPTPTPTPTAEPTLTPLPTATPTPTSIPMARRDFEGEVQGVLFPLWAGEPETAPTAEPLCTSDPRGENLGKLAAMVFANVAVYEKPSETAEVLGRESYHLVYIHNLQKDFYLVTTQEGRKGYVKASSLTPLSEADVEAYLSAAMQLTYTAGRYSPEAFLSELATFESAGPMEERIYAALCRLGLDFEPYYYRAYKKDFSDETKYPQYYKDEVYNSLAFKLFNSTGSLVYYEGQRTQWEYVPTADALLPGDILFFTELPKRNTGVLEGCEFVVAGHHSGKITDCAVYLGDDSILTLVEGRVGRMDNFSASPLFKSFDSARRIHLAVYDEKQLIVEDMIAQVYDCLGTPYSNYVRTGDFSFDCSGLISWLLVRMEMYPTGYVYYHWTESSASGLSNILKYTWRSQKQIEMAVPVPTATELKDLDSFERGDIIFLLASKGGTIGHVMLYLGDGRVIHSTYISRRYSGTVVANFRHALQKLYYTSLRIETIS